MQILREEAGCAWCSPSGAASKQQYNHTLTYLYTYAYIFDVNICNTNQKPCFCQHFYVQERNVK